MITDQHPAIAAAETPGIASLAVRDLLHGSHQSGRMLAVIQGTITAEFPGARREPRGDRDSCSGRGRPPNAIIVGIPAGTATATSP